MNEAKHVADSPESALEKEARNINIDDPHHVNPGDVAVGVVIGRTSEFFDFFVFAVASVIVFPAWVFPYADPVVGTIYCFAIFALAFIARPFGTMLFNYIDHRQGKSARLTSALLMLGTATVAIGFLPSYDSIGNFSVAILIILRIMQGLAIGGSWDGLASLLALDAPDEKRSFYTMVPQIGAAVGFLVATGLFAYFLAVLSPEDFYDWGWRYPFFVAFAINVVALFARLRIVVTPEYTKLFRARELQPEPIFKTVRSEGPTILLGAFVPLATFALFHMMTVFPLSWIFLYTDEEPWHFLTISSVASAFFLVGILASGWLAAKYGRRRLLRDCAIATAAFSGFAPQFLDGGVVGEIFFMFSGFALLGICFGQSSGVVAQRFSKRFRYTGSAITSDMAWLFGAGFAPLAALSLSAYFGLIAAGAYLLSGAICTIVALGVANRLDRKG
ncbi:MFS transporter [Palleronia sp. LCG004]|uniref:MFS transporter n=1 Tax=Palleronia sp. LCG004 TaxID=3079304 RepID=UPI002943D732|nr:MFS transporter [Palleronia sp. LCG004]WOI57752.1 MFS transporter [Palleronia sp. LCG004]